MAQRVPLEPPQNSEPRSSVGQGHLAFLSARIVTATGSYGTRRGYMGASLSVAPMRSVSQCWKMDLGRWLSSWSLLLLT
jgi:hypothetical protein